MDPHEYQPQPDSISRLVQSLPDPSPGITQSLNVVRIEFQNPVGEEVVLQIPERDKYDRLFGQFEKANDMFIANRDPRVWLVGGIEQPLHLLYGATAKDIQDVPAYLEKLYFGIMNDPLKKRLRSIHLSSIRHDNRVISIFASGTGAEYSTPHKLEFYLTDENEYPKNQNYALPEVRYFVTNSTTARITAIQRPPIAGGSYDRIVEEVTKSRESIMNLQDKYHARHAQMNAFFESITALNTQDPDLCQSISLMENQVMKIIDDTDWTVFNDFFSGIDYALMFLTQQENQKSLTRALSKDIRGLPLVHLTVLSMAVTALHQAGIRHIEMPTYLPVQPHFFAAKPGESPEESADRIYNYITDLNMRLARELVNQIPGANIYDPPDDHLIVIDLPEILQFNNTILMNLARQLSSSLSLSTSNNAHS